MKKGGMGSNKEKTEALKLCKARKRFIKQAIQSRYSFAASHVSYTQSLKTLGISLRKYAESESLSLSSCPSPSHTAPISDSSPLPLESPLSARCSYMRTNFSSSVTVEIRPSRNGYAENVVDTSSSVSFTMPPPPPPLPEAGSTWDYFDPSEDFDDLGDHSEIGFEKGEVDNDDDKFVTPESSSNGNRRTSINGVFEEDVNGLARALMVKSASEPSSSKREKGGVKREIGEEREDPSEFITHRAKDFVSSIKDIEHRFFRASESGKEVSRMLEANKICVGYSEANVGSSISDFLGALRFVCCRMKTSLVSNEPSEGTTKVITWKRTTSSRSSSSRNHLNSASKDDNDGSESDFVEEFCMISGSHSSTLERLYAWERKLYDEVKASESIRKEYDRKCDQLRHQFAKDLSTHVIDKTRSVVKDLHSRIRVALHAVDAISKRIEKMRDDELQPQLVELIQGLIRMWKSMLECHHAQYITISLAYHAKTSNTNASQETQKKIMTELEEEIECFGLSFANWINSHTTYVEALNGWLQNCIMLPRERSSRRRAFSPRRVLAPPIFVLSRDWSAGIKSLPSEELSDAIKGFLSDLRCSIRQQAEEQKAVDLSKNSEEKVEEKSEDRASNLCSIHSSLAKVLDRLTKFSEASLKMCEDIRQKCETARNAYSNYRPHRF